MCGIAGFAGLERPGLVERMTARLTHRGPDASGHVVDGDVALGHRRLSIIDLAGGAQPMETRDGRFVLTYNGEIYNFAELRDELSARGETFDTDSDTEVLLRLWRLEGPGCLDRLNGMFVFAVFDRSSRELWLARDRVGIKPLTYVTRGGALWFASETKALLESDAWERAVDPHALAGYLALRYVPGSGGLFREVRRLPAGHVLRWKAGAVEVRRWWSPPAPLHPSDAGEGELLDELERRLVASIRRRSIADVPLGAYLSGGLDSSVIAALLAREGAGSVKTFSVGFDYEHDELEQAAATAKLIGADHTEVQCRAEHCALLPEIVYHADEPLGDPINIPMYLLAREAKKSVTVILTGEGADEVFGGYLFHKVLWAGELYRRLVPGPLRRGLVRPALGLVPARALDLAFQYPADLGRRGKQKALDYLDVLEHADREREYRHLISLFDERDTAGLFSDAFAASLAAAPPGDDPGPAFDHLLRLQFGHWLPDNMLARGDRMSMASAIEARVPYLDHELIELAFDLPRRLRLRRLTGKVLLRRLGERVLPRETARRRKMPFYVPVEDHFASSTFRDLLDDLLSPEAVRDRGLFRPEAVEDLRARTHRGEFVLVKQVFSLMTLELWFRIFVDGNGDLAAAG